MLSRKKVSLNDAIHSERALTYPRWNQNTNRLAHYLREGLRGTKSARASFNSANRVEYLTVLPKTAAIKVDKKQLISQYGAEMKLDAR